MPPVVAVEEPTDVFGTCNNISNLFEITDVLQNEVDCVCNTWLLENMPVFFNDLLTSFLVI
jgi:hypothetical protein